MSRRKQANPRAVKREEDWDETSGNGSHPFDSPPPSLGDIFKVNSTIVAGCDTIHDPETSLRGLRLDLLHRDAAILGGSDDSGDCDEDDDDEELPGDDDTPNIINPSSLIGSGVGGGSGAGAGGGGGGGAGAGGGSGILLGNGETPIESEVIYNPDGENSLESALGTEAGSSWRSDTPEDLSRSPSSCATPNSASELPEAELAFTHGVTEATPYPCQFCDKAFPRLSYLKKHEQTHSDQMPFRCEFCSRLFKHKRSRDRHIKLHTGDKKYRCANCEAAFSRSDHLKIHMKTHDTQKPFQCTICTRGYNTAAALTSHMQSHKRAASGVDGNSGGPTGINPFPDGIGYRCLQCGDAFKLPEQLQNHMASVHVNDSPPPPGACSPPQSASSAAAAAAAAAAAIGLLQAAASSRPGLSSHNHLTTSLHHHHHHLHLSSSSAAASTNSITTLSNSLASVGAAQQPLPSHSHPPPPPPPPPPPHTISQQLHHLPASAKLACIYCTKDTFTTMEQLQLHVQAMHGSIVNGELREYSPPSPVPPPPPPPPQPLPPPSATAAATATATATSLHSQAQSSISDTVLSNYSCDLCTMRFASAHALRKHCNQQHATEITTGGSHSMSSSATGGPSSAAPLCCAPCALPFATTAQFAEHYLLVHAAAAVAAAVEQLGPTDLSKPKRARLDYPPQGPLLCNQCSAALPDFEAFRTHLKMHLDGTVQSPLSGHSGNNNNICPHCCIELPSDGRRAELHLATHFMSSETEYGCQSCLKLFPKQEDLQRHLLDLHAHHLYRCTLCKDLFDSKVAIQVHFAVKHSNECKLLRCTACPPGSTSTLSSLFRSELELCSHIRTTHINLLSPATTNTTNTPPGPLNLPGHRCPFCRLSCNSELEMQLHLAAHAKHFRCPICRETFHVEFLLDRHMHTHHGQPPMNSAINGNVVGGLSPQDSGSAKPSPRLPTPNSSTPGLNQSLTPPGIRCNGQISPPAIVNSNDVTNENDMLLRKTSSCGGVSLNGSITIGNNSNGKSLKSSSSSSTVNVSLQCAYCSEVCKTRAELENHMKTHSGQVNVSATNTTAGGVPNVGTSNNTIGTNKHKCNICDELCPSAAILAEHKLTHCKVVGGALCTHCKSPLTSENDYQQHLRQHQPQLPAACIVCRQTLSSELEARLHARFHLQQSQQQQQDVSSTVVANRQCCALCLKSTESPLIPAGATGAYLCTDCISRASPQPSANSQSTGAPPTSTSPNMKPNQTLQHLNTTTNTQQQQHRCSECQVKFETKEALEVHHLQTHRINFTSGSGVGGGGGGSGGDVRPECRLCVRLFPTQTHLQSHLIEHTFAGCGAFTCYLCSAVFTTAHGLQTHMPEHGAASRPYDCPRCGVKFFFRAELDNHAFMHLDTDAVASNPTHQVNSSATFQEQQKRNGHGPLSLGRSSRPSSRKGSASPGVAVEGGTGLLPCHECGKQFASPRSLAAHIKNHNNSSLINGTEIQVKREFKEEPLENISDPETNMDNTPSILDEHHPPDGEEDIDVTTGHSDSNAIVSS